jgi:NAD(P)-dependent dehydrogenase (short-subunit alcohol dehydrogenase family)/acyl dehydratase
MRSEASGSAVGHRLRFSHADIESFAAASGDRNPLHLDAGFARHTPFGACVVHGALVAIGMLGSLSADQLAQTRTVRVRFSGPVMPETGCLVSVRQSRRTAGACELTLSARGKVLARAVASPDREIHTDDLTADGSGLRPLGPPMAQPAMRLMPAQPSLDELSPGLSIHGSYRTGPQLASLAGRFGAAPLDRALLEGLAWASYVVGMELPGRHSLLAGITIRSCADHAEPRAAGHVVGLSEHDRRTGQLVLDGRLRSDVGATLSHGVIECFALAPVADLDPNALGVDGSETADRGSVVVIGGSRGFGAALTLALLGRGHRVHAAYSSSADSAAALVELAGAHGDRLSLHQLDARDPGALHQLADQLQAEAPLAGLVLSAAPPPLSMGLTAESGAELADYVAESLRLVAVGLGALLPLLGAGAWILFCSSSALDAPPRDWPHYVTAKAALEGLARWLGATSPAVRTVVLRPPAMRTELTNTPSGRLAAVPTESIAAWIADRLVGGELATGYSRLEPDLVAELRT